MRLMWKRSCRRRCAKIEEKPDKEVQMEVMVAVEERMGKHTVVKSQTNATNVTLHPQMQAV